MADNQKIDVHTKTRYLEEQSAPDAGRFVFSYTIRITNKGTSPAKLLTRHWVITDGEGQIQKVDGDGVVGEQPLIQPGKSFEYTSGAMLETPFGTMHGHYQFRSQSGELFEAPIPAFLLSTPNSVH
ncbi:MAG: Co2+/Mg2+ efflux protein ApaG [Gammaproteobacteria bacterium]|nr:Co2+/Mg2+ efflux protein ApaG [Gammaproteobacteria bacterium]